MDSPLSTLVPNAIAPPPLPGWSVVRGAQVSEKDVAFAAGIALKSLDDCVRSAPQWAGCWRQRQALKCAANAVRLMGRNEDEAALRDAVLLTAPGDDAGPAGNIYRAFKLSAGRKPGLSLKSAEEMAALLGLRWDEALSAACEHFQEALRSGRAAPFAAALLVSSIYAVRPDAEVLAWILADQLIAAMLKWDRPVPIFMGERFGKAFRTLEGRGRVLPGEPGFEKAVCFALISGIDAALRSAAVIARRAQKLIETAPKVRTKGKEKILQTLLGDDALLASAPGTQLSRWAATRMFDRLETFEAVRELSGRPSFKIYGL